MANDQNRDRNRDQNRDQNREQGRDEQRDRTIGEGMNSPDSTQMPLKASTGEPDWETQSKGNAGDQSRTRQGGADQSDASARGGRQNTGGSGGNTGS